MRVLVSPPAGKGEKDWREEEPVRNQDGRYRQFLWKEASPTRGTMYCEGEPQAQKVHKYAQGPLGVEMLLTTGSADH